MRDSFVFYESFYLSLCELSATQQGKIYTAICRYALYGDEPELKGASAAVFKLIKPQIDANNRRYENGKKGAQHGIKGGRSKNPKETPREPQTNPKQTPNVNVNVNVPVPVNVPAPVNSNVNVNDNDNDNGSGGSPAPDDDRFNIWKKMSAEDVDAVYEAYPESGGYLIDAVYEEVKKKRKEVNDPVAYIIGYAKNVQWDDNAQH